jgi:hypothetical protein
VQHIAAQRSEDDVRYRARATTNQAPEAGRARSTIQIDCIPGGFFDWVLRRRARTVYANPGVDRNGDAGWLLPTGRTPNRGMLDAIDEISVRLRDNR